MATISTRSRYGLRLLVDLAEHPGEGHIDLHSIAERQAIPESYLAKLASTLLMAGIITSVRGAKGGYALARPPEEIDLFSVVEVLEGRLSLLECSSSPDRSSSSPDCGSKSLWLGLEEAMRSYLVGKNLASVTSSSGSPEYYI